MRYRKYNVKLWPGVFRPGKCYRRRFIDTLNVFDSLSSLRVNIHSTYSTDIYASIIYGDLLSGYIGFDESAESIFPLTKIRQPAITYRAPFDSLRDKFRRRNYPARPSKLNLPARVHS